MKTIETLKEIYLVKTFYWCLRAGMGLTFVLSGIRKLPGHKFTALPIENPIGFYFEAMHSTGFYWHFIGGFQLLIGILIFFNRFVVASTLLMMPVTVNIFLVSIALNMSGTPLITSLMVLGNVFLLLYHHKNYRPILDKPR